MFIHAKTTIVRTHRVRVKDLAEFHSRFPNAEIETIDGIYADTVCEQGHPYRSHWRCEECHGGKLCAGCGHINRECQCIPF